MIQILKEKKAEHVEGAAKTFLHEPLTAIHVLFLVKTCLRYNFLLVLQCLVLNLKHFKLCVELCVHVGHQVLFQVLRLGQLD